jgi:hypothetical protein
LFPQIPSMEASGRLKITAFLFTRSMELLSLALLMLSVHKFNYHYQFRFSRKFIFYIFSLSILNFFSDHIFDESSTNSSVYELLTKDIIHAALNGFNGIQIQIILSHFSLIS